jgi:hypothetical protein
MWRTPPDDVLEAETRARPTLGRRLIPASPSRCGPWHPRHSLSLRAFRRAAILLAPMSVLLAVPAVAFALNYRTGTYGGMVRVRPGAFTIFKWSMSEDCGSVGEGLFAIPKAPRFPPMRAISGTVSRHGALHGTGHDGKGTQEVTGHVAGKTMTITLKDTASDGPGGLVCRGKATRHLRLNGPS